MGTYDNIKDRIMRKPTANDITDKEIKRFLEGFGFELARSKGSHFIYKYKEAFICSFSFLFSTKQNACRNFSANFSVPE